MLAAAERRSAVAVAWQRAAVDAHAASDAYVPAHVARRRLVLYERGDACRQPWEAEERLVTLPVEAPEPEA
jgi:hypothetical protein